MAQPHKMHPNSLDAYREEKAKLGDRAQEIITMLETQSTPISDREIKEKMKFSDMNMVRPRITELILAGLVFEVGKHPCETTGKSVRLVQHWKYVDSDRRQMELF